MRKTTVLWLIVVFIAGTAGYVVGTSHNRPRVMFSTRMIDYTLNKPASGSSTIAYPRIDEINKRLQSYETAGTAMAKEDWVTHNGDPVTLLYFYQIDSVLIKRQSE